MTTRSQEPLIANNAPPSEGSEEDRIEEEDALLTGQRTNKQAPSTFAKSKWKDWILFTWALLATAAVVVLAVVYQHSQTEARHDGGESGDVPSGKRNLIFMVSE
jgi:alkaline phosphatase